MSPVGGSRFYQGGGLGVEAGWACPSCGAENAGPISQGCGVCGAGKPGQHIGTAPPPAPPQVEPEPPPAAPVDEEQLGLYDRWALKHPKATLEDAFTAGYVEGAREMRRNLHAQQLKEQQARQAQATPPDQSKIARTIVAALEYFTEQVLQFEPDEVTRNDWCSAAEVRQLIEQLTTTGEVAHA